MNPYLIIPSGASSLHAVGVPKCKVISFDDGIVKFLDVRGVSTLLKLKFAWHHLTPDYLKVGSTVERECPECAHLMGRDTNKPVNLFKHLKNIDDPCKHCTKGTQSFTVPDNIELQPFNLYFTLFAMDDVTEAKGIVKLMDFWEENGNPDYILVSRDLEGSR